MKPKVVCLLLLFVSSSCNLEKNESEFLTKAKGIIKSDYVQAKSYLDSIDSPLQLDNKDFALFTYLSCITADSLKADLPLHSEIKIAANWYLKHDEPLKTTRMLLYLGRSSDYYEEDHEAMDSYLKALSMAVDNNYSNEAGYISSYIGDLYSENNDMFAAATKYKEAANYFSIAENFKSQAYAYRDLGRSWALVDSLNLAMNAFDKAEKIARSIDANMALSTILNGKGNIYRFMGIYDLAEETLLNSLNLDTIGSVATINALTSIYIEQGKFSNAKYLLDSLSKISLNDDYTNTLDYKYFLLYDAQNKNELALNYLKKVFDYDQFLIDDDSRISFHELEKKYNHVVLVSQIDKMRIQTRFYIVIIIILLVAVLSLIIIYQYRIIKDKKRIAEQDKEIQNLMTKYYFTKNELENKKEIISNYSAPL